jgi:hypothetical protein
MVRTVMMADGHPVDRDETDTLMAFNLIAGTNGQQRGGERERLARLGDVPPAYLPPAPRPGPFGALCRCGTRGVHPTQAGDHRPA